MRVTKDHVPPRPSRPTAADAAASTAESLGTWLGVAVGGTALAIIGAVAVNSLALAIGLVALAVAGARVGFLDGRRRAAPDPRVPGLTRERDQWRTLAERLLADAQRDLGSAPAGGGVPQPAAPAAARPSAAVRGGGRPGAVAASPFPGPDAEAADEDGTEP